MGTMSLSLPQALREFVDAQVERGGYETSSEYLRELIRRDQDRTKLRALMLDGAQSGLAGKADEEYFGRLRKQASPGRPVKPRA
jgi:antitoxin ParD1/3/4